MWCNGNGRNGEGSGEIYGLHKTISGITLIGASRSSKNGVIDEDYGLINEVSTTLLGATFFGASRFTGDGIID